MMDIAGERSGGRVQDRIVEEHRTIAGIMRKLETARDLEELLWLLREFRGVLTPHFVGEEAPDGFFDTVHSRAPRHVGTLARLRKEHEALMAEVERLAHRAQACLAGPVAEVLRGAEDLTRRVRAHEAAENELLADAMYVDLGEDD